MRVPSGIANELLRSTIGRVRGVGICLAFTDRLNLNSDRAKIIGKISNPKFGHKRTILILRH
ncbi:hypothetical protein C7B77_12230 [Chamaesiphon polymorphus CCALA 037]|uniref:Uncharacterized protein n=1 Tax=Chamaesiphon polymorphus CCALA 037 TaxID=2107692 RepID=A0A2T1GFF4_9CYAN|nr:hypothetical protein C7B77_12230 [Chamaesiphon polymorphus CCALA 037]